MDENVKDYIDAQLKAQELIFKNRLRIIEENTNYRVERRLQNIDAAIIQTKAELKTTMNQMFVNAEFVKTFQRSMEKQILYIVHNEIRGKGFDTWLVKAIQDKIKDGFKEIVENTVETIMNRMNKKLDKELRVTKELCYSVDSEIRHLMQRNPEISSHSEGMIHRKIKGVIDEYETKILAQIDARAKTFLLEEKNEKK